MTPWEDAKEILKLIQEEENWTPEFFKRCQENTVLSPCIHNQIRKVFTPEQYQRFDDAYCFSIRPEQKRIVNVIRKENTRKEGKEKRIKELNNMSTEELLRLLQHSVEKA